jgi:lipopolysaccharide biosynthesis protein
MSPLPSRRWFKTEATLSRSALWRASVLHFVQKVALLTVGSAYTSSWAAVMRRRRDKSSTRPEYPRRVALVAHAFYPEVIDEILVCYATLPRNAELIVTAPPDRFAAIEKRLSAVENKTTKSVQNRGRDIAPFLDLLNSGALDTYDVILKLHTKRSPNLIDGHIRRRILFAMLAGSRRRTATALALFNDPSTGLVGWRPSWRSSAVYWMTDHARTAELAAQMGIVPPAVPSFFEGSMFWVRPSALKRLRLLNLSPADFELEHGQTDGALHHAIERVFSLAAAADGYVTRDLSGRRLDVVAQPARGADGTRERIQAGE